MYKFEKKLGAGTFGTVRTAYRPFNPNKKYAIKTIKRELIEDEIESLEQELAVMLSVDHPNIVKVYEIYLDHKYVHIVMEWCPGGEVFDLVQKKGTLDETSASKLIRMSLLALAHLHE